jgi:hypothetical protein
MRSVYGVSHDLMNENRSADQATLDFTTLKSDFDKKREYFEVGHPILYYFEKVVKALGQVFDVEDPSSLIAGNVINSNKNRMDAKNILL